MLDINNFLEKVKPSDIDKAGLLSARQILLPSGVEFLSKLRDSKAVKHVGLAARLTEGDLAETAENAFVHGLNTGIILANKVAGSASPSQTILADELERAIKIGATTSQNLVEILSVSEAAATVAEIVTEGGGSTEAGMAALTIGFAAAMALSKGVEFFPELEIDDLEAAATEQASAAAGD